MTDYSVPSPAELAKTGAHVERIDDVPMMLAGDRPFWGFMYTFDPYEGNRHLECVRSMYARGVRLFSFLLPLVVAWDKPGPYDWTLLDELHDRLLEAAPDGLFFPRVFMTTPHWWDDENPNELIGFRGGRPPKPSFANEHLPLWKYETKLYHDPKNPSFASTKWRRDASAVLSAYVKRTWEGRHAGHWLGYQIAYGSCGEWTPFGLYMLNRFGSADFCKPMVAAFRAFLRNKYGSDAALQQAWDEPGITLATAEPPTKLQLLKTDLGVLKDPRKCRHGADWTELYVREKYDAILHFCRAAKQAAPVPVLTGSFVGYRVQVGCSAYIAQLAETGLDRVLASDAIDILATPNWYHDRLKGVCSQAPMASIARKKIFFAENDVRTHLSGSPPNAFRCGPDPKAGMRHFKRDTFYNLTQGSGHLWWYDFGNGWYLDAKIESVIAKLVKASTRLGPRERRGQAEVAYVVDEASMCHTEGSSDYLRLSKDSLNEHFPKMGAPYDLITYEDMIEREPYKLYFFRDLFYAPDVKIDRLRGFLKRHQASAVWMFACGLLGETGIDTARAERLTGFRLRLIDTLTSQQLTVTDVSHAITRGVPLTVGTLGNDDTRGVYAPLLYIDDPHATILGQIESMELPGIGFKRDGARFDAWFASPLLPYQVLANLAREAGVHRYVEPGVALFGQGRLFCLQNDRTGVGVFKPRRATRYAEDLLTGERHAPDRHGHIHLPLEEDEPVLIRLAERAART